MDIDQLFFIVEEFLQPNSLTLEYNNSISQLAQEASKALSYPLTAGGKRVRPLLVALVAGVFGGKLGLEVSRHSARAVELLHTYSLVHDDLPCMDNDDLRRGMPTVHKVYGEAKGLLVGDALLTQAFFELSQTHWQNGPQYTQELFACLSKAAGAEGMIWGQWLDLAAVQDSWDTLEIIHRHKTGKLLGACLEMGFICALSQMEKADKIPQSKSCRENLFQAGELIGVAFQIIDDLLDNSQPSSALGKTPNKDFSQGKRTAIYFLGQETAEKKAFEYTQCALEKIASTYSYFLPQDGYFDPQMLTNFILKLLQRNY